MGTISVSLPSDGTTADVADYNTPITTIVNEVNGNLDNDNLSSTAAIAGSKLASASVTASKIDFGGSGAGIWWEEIGRTTLSAAGDTITVDSLSPKKYLLLWVSLLNTGGTIDGLLRFNNDTGTNYAERRSTDGAADATTTSATSIGIIATQSATPRFSVVEIINIASFEKLAHIRNVTQGAAGAATAPSRREAVGKWANTSAQISRIDVVNAGTGDFAVGSEVVVLGHD